MDVDEFIRLCLFLSGQNEWWTFIIIFELFCVIVELLKRVSNSICLEVVVLLALTIFV